MTDAYGGRPPRIRVVPAPVKNLGPVFVRAAAVAGFSLDPWQRELLHDLGGVGKDGKPAAQHSIILVPRQNGKSELLAALIVVLLYAGGVREIAFSAHEARTTSIVFRRIVRAVESAPQLGAKVKRTSNTRGAEEIELDSGAIVRCFARTGTSGRGYSAEVLILDEGQYLTQAMVEAALPMIAARPGARIVYALSAGNPESVHLGRLRAQALRREPGIMWDEWSMGEADDPADRKVWRACNPAFPVRVTEKTLEQQYRALGPAGFSKEHLALSAWPVDEWDRWRAVSRSAWDAAAGGDADRGQLVALGVAVSPDLLSAAVGVAGRGHDGRPVVDVADYRMGAGSGWVRDRVVELASQYRVAGVAWNEKTAAGALGLAGVVRGRRRALTMEQAADAEVKFKLGIDDGVVLHAGDDALTMAMGAAALKAAGGGRLGFDRSTTGVEVVQAAAYALLGLSGGYDILRSVAGPS